MMMQSFPALDRVSTPPPSGLDLLWTPVGRALDTTVMRAVQIVVERALIPNEQDVTALRRSADRLLDPALLENPKRFFAFLDGSPPPAKVENLGRRAVAYIDAL